MDYRQTIEEAKKRFEELAARRTEIEREMEGLLQIMRGAEIVIQPAGPIQEAPDIPESPTNLEVGFTDKVRLVLARSSGPLTPTEVRDGLEIMSVEGASAKNILIHVHNVLRRLLENGEITQVPREGKMAYKMLNPLERVAIALRSPYGFIAAGPSLTRGIKEGT
jgi:hypothetical protein